MTFITLNFILISLVLFFLFSRSSRKELKLSKNSKKGVYLNNFILIIFFIATIGAFYAYEFNRLDDAIMGEKIDSLFNSELTYRESIREELKLDLIKFFEKKQIAVETLYVMASRFKSEEEFLLSAMSYKELIKSEPMNIPGNIFAEYAQVLFFLNKKLFTSEVNNNLTVALDKSPNNPVALTLRGLRGFQEGKEQEAFDDWSKALEFITDASEKRILQAAIDNLK